jgi:hypothetical protein
MLNNPISTEKHSASGPHGRTRVRCNKTGVYPNRGGQGLRPHRGRPSRATGGSWRVAGCSGGVDLAPHARDEACQVEGVGRTVGLLVCLQAARCAFDEPGGTDGVAACVMGQAHAQLRQALPQGAFVVRARLPPNLKSFMSRERTPLLQQAAGVGQGLFRSERFLRDGLDPRCAVLQGSSKRIAWPRLLRTSLFVAIAIGNHVRNLPRPDQARGSGHYDLA